MAERGSEVLGSVWILEARDSAYLTWVGSREGAENHALDLYFNLAYAGLARALERGFPRIEMGQTAAQFKARLGARHSTRYLYLKGLDPVRALAIKYGLKLLHPGRPDMPDFNVFMSAGLPCPCGRRRRAHSRLVATQNGGQTPRRADAAAPSPASAATIGAWENEFPARP